MALPVTEPRFTEPYAAEDVVHAIYIGGDGELADLYRLKLELDGYGVTLAFSGIEGLAQARKRLPDIMFIDLGPGDESLLQTHRILRGDHVLKDIPAVLVWRGDSDAPTIERLGLGAKDFLVKAKSAHSAYTWTDVTSGRIPFDLIQ